MNKGPFINPIFYSPLEGQDPSQSNLLHENSYVSGDDQSEFFSIQSPVSILSTTSYSPSVQVRYNGTGLHTICGTTPMLTLGHTFNRTEAGILLSVVNKITLNGKIYNRDNTASGISYVLGQERQLKDLFKNCPNGNLEVFCGCTSDTGGTSVIAFTGARALNITTENSPDFLTKSIGYTIELENIEASGSSSNAYVVSASDTWNIEPVADDYIYETFAISTSTRSEYHNPYAPDGAPSETSPKTYSALQINQIPQFKVSRKLSARGIIHESGCGGGSGYYNAYLSARQWVSDRLSAPWASSNSSGAYFGGAYNASTMTNSMFLYNHIRATNFSITEGTYEINDTWLAMPTGITHTEDYTIDVSTDEKYIKTVKVNGTIKGLALANTSLVTGTSQLVPDGSGKMDLSVIKQTGQTGSMTYALDTSSAYATTNHQNNRYSNALIGWHSGVKPFLYRRANAALNATRYTDTYVPSDYSRTKPLKNPTYSKDTLLNIIPWSTSETHDPRKGIITYGYEFNNKYTLISGVISESINIEDTGPNDVVAEVFVIGRRLGPILQSLSAKTSSKRSVSIDITVMPATGLNQYFMTNSQCPLWTGGQAYDTIDKILEGLKPFGTRDGAVFPNLNNNNKNGQVYQTENSQSWNPTEGRYSRKAAWVYQQCNNNKLYLDN